MRSLRYTLLIALPLSLALWTSVLFTGCAVNQAVIKSQAEHAVKGAALGAGIVAASKWFGASDSVAAIVSMFGCQAIVQGLEAMETQPSQLDAGVKGVACIGGLAIGTKAVDDFRAYHQHGGKE